MTYEEACGIVAKNHGLGNRLVTGHAAKYFAEAAELYKDFHAKDFYGDVEEHEAYIPPAIEQKYTIPEHARVAYDPQRCGEIKRNDQC